MLVWRIVVVSGRVAGIFIASVLACVNRYFKGRFLCGCSQNVCMYDIVYLNRYPDLYRLTLQIS